MLRLIALALVAGHRSHRLHSTHPMLVRAFLSAWNPVGGGQGCSNTPAMGSRAVDVVKTSLPEEMGVSHNASRRNLKTAIVRGVSRTRTTAVLVSYPRLYVFSAKLRPHSDTAGDLHVIYSYFVPPYPSLAHTL